MSIPTGRNEYPDHELERDLLLERRLRVLDPSSDDPSRRAT